MSRGVIAACRRCYGSGLCSLCQAVKVIDLGKPPALTVDGGDAATPS